LLTTALYDTVATLQLDVIIVMCPKSSSQCYIWMVLWVLKHSQIKLVFKISTDNIKNAVVLVFRFHSTEIEQQLQSQDALAGSYKPKMHKLRIKIRPRLRSGSTFSYLVWFKGAALRQRKR